MDGRLLADSGGLAALNPDIVAGLGPTRRSIRVADAVVVEAGGAWRIDPRDFCISLAVALRTFVLLTSLLFEDDDLFATAMADDRRLNRPLADLRILPAAKDESRDVDLCAFFAFEARNAKRLAVFNRELFAARFDDCVTH